MLLSLSLENREDSVDVLLFSICKLREALPGFYSSVFIHRFSEHFAASVCIRGGARQDVFKLQFTEVLLFARLHVRHFTYARLVSCRRLLETGGIIISFRTKKPRFRVG